jgi:L-serine dehydratase
VRLSVFDIFKIGIRPPSSHTVGPMNASRRFAEAVEPAFDRFDRIAIEPEVRAGVVLVQC